MFLFDRGILSLMLSSMSSVQDCCSLTQENLSYRMDLEGITFCWVDYTSSFIISA
jgi:hypothetical protein